MSSPRSYQWLLAPLLGFQNAIETILSWELHRRYGVNRTQAVLVAELSKLLISTAVILRTKGTFKVASDFRIMGISALYGVQNQLFVSAAMSLSPFIVAVAGQSKLLFAIWAEYVVLGKAWPSSVYLAFLRVLLLGMAFASSSVESGAPPSLIGGIVLISALWLSGINGSLVQRSLQDTSASLFEVNFALSLWGCVLAGFAASAEPASLPAMPEITLGLIRGAGGLGTAFLVKYLGNVSRASAMTVSAVIAGATKTHSFATTAIAVALCLCSVDAEQLRGTAKQATTTLAKRQAVALASVLTAAGILLMVSRSSQDADFGPGV